MGFAGFVLGIIGLLCTTIMPFLFPHLVIATPFCVGVGLPLSWVAFRRTRMLATGAADVPRAGLVINIVTLVLFIALSILVIQIAT